MSGQGEVTDECPPTSTVNAYSMMDFNGQTCFITPDQARSFSAPVVGSGLSKRLLNSPNDLETPLKKPMENTPENAMLINKACEASDVFRASLQSPSFLSKIVEALVNPVAETVAALLKDMLIQQFHPVFESKVKNLVENDSTVRDIVQSEVKKSVSNVIDSKITHCMNKEVDSLQRQIQSQNSKISLLTERIAKLESGQQKLLISHEEQEQYSRRTCLKFINLPVTEFEDTHTFDPLKAIQKVCRDKLNIVIDDTQVSRCHILGAISTERKVTAIVRFVRYTDRQRVFEAKSKLKGNPDKTLVVEALTKHRQRLVNVLNKNRYLNNIHAFWTRDGQIYAKKTQDSNSRIMVRNDEDLITLGCVIDNRTPTNGGSQ